MSTEATFPLIEEPEEEPSTPGVGSPLLADVDLRAGYGYGLLTPFRRDARNDFVSGGGSALLASKIAQVLGTRADDGKMTGELPWRTNFGSLLFKLRFDNLDETFAALARSRVVTALATWLPQVKVVSLQVLRTHNADGNIAGVMRLSYNVVQPNTGNLLVSNQYLDVPLSS